MSSSTNNTLDNGLVNASVDSYGSQIVEVIWGQVGLALVFLGLRIYCKLFKHRGLWWDDYVLIAAWIASIVTLLALVCDAVISSASVSFGFGRHVYDIDPDNLPTISLLGQFAATAASLAAVLSKTSFGITLLRITKGTSQAAAWFFIISMNVAMGVSVLVNWIQCTPVQKIWDRTIPGTCWDPKVSVYSAVVSAVYSGICDLALAMLPWTVIWGLQMKKKEKIGVAVAMSMGVFAGVFSFIKSSYIPLLLQGDFTYVGYELVLWGAAEVAITIMAASIPVLRVMLREVKTATRRRYNASFGTKITNPGMDMYHTHNSEMVPVSRVDTTIKSEYTAGRDSKSDHRGSADSGCSRHGLARKLTSRANNSPPGDLGAGRILQTQEISIQYQEIHRVSASGSITPF